MSKKSFPLIDTTEPNLIEETFDYNLPPLIRLRQTLQQSSGVTGRVVLGVGRLPAAHPFFLGVTKWITYHSEPLAI